MGCYAIWANGKGRMLFKSGTAAGESYEGEFKDNLYEGTGVYKYHHGQCYEGQYKAGHRHGRGTLKWDEGMSGYTGDWLAGKRCGYGLCQYQDGDWYSGEWSDDRWHGKGTKYEDDKGIISSGVFEFDALHGKVKEYSLIDTKEYYRGKLMVT